VTWSEVRQILRDALLEFHEKREDVTSYVQSRYGTHHESFKLTKMHSVERRNKVAPMIRRAIDNTRGFDEEMDPDGFANDINAVRMQMLCNAECDVLSPAATLDYQEAMIHLEMARLSLMRAGMAQKLPV
tara:strand:- start:49 stop:438 length:390 start_codon:yes stop_codon:yes gene_type:complete